MNRQKFTSFMVYSVIRKGATDITFKYLLGVVMITYKIDGVQMAEEIVKTPSLNRAAQYETWFNRIVKEVVA